jgi:hypothetical protein
MRTSMAEALHNYLESEEVVWIVGECDDLIDAVFSTVEAAEAHFNVRVAEFRLKHPKRHPDDHFWWIAKYPFNPKAL